MNILDLFVVISENCNEFVKKLKSLFFVLQKTTLRMFVFALTIMNY